MLHGHNPLQIKPSKLQLYVYINWTHILPLWSNGVLNLFSLNIIIQLQENVLNRGHIAKIPKNVEHILRYSELNRYKKRLGRAAKTSHPFHMRIFCRFLIISARLH